MTDDHNPAVDDERESRIRALQRLLYAKDAGSDPEARRRAAEELATLEHAARSRDTAPGPDAAAASADEQAIAPATGPDASEPAALAGSTGRGRSALVAGAAAAVALVAGIVIGASIAGGWGGDVGAAAGSDSPNSIAAFERDQEPRDRPDIDLSANLRPGSFRIITTAGLDELYLARDTSGRVCLVAVIQTREFSASCAAPDDLKPAGLRLLWTSLTPFRDLPGSQARASFAFTWQPDGTTAMQATG